VKNSVEMSLDAADTSVCATTSGSAIFHELQYSCASVFIFLFVLELHQNVEGSLEVSLQSALVLQQQPEVGFGGQGSVG
jgi:hypothetical protein